MRPRLEWALVALVLGGCAYYSTSGGLIGGIRTVGIPVAENQSAEFAVAERLTERRARSDDRKCHENSLTCLPRVGFRPLRSRAPDESSRRRGGCASPRIPARSLSVLRDFRDARNASEHDG